MQRSASSMAMANSSSPGLWMRPVRRANSGMACGSSTMKAVSAPWTKLPIVPSRCMARAPACVARLNMRSVGRYSVLHGIGPSEK